MKYVQSGKGEFPLISLIAILSISLVVNLPGLAISPLMGKLDTIFTSVSDLEIQLLEILPNLFIIPFVLLSGRLSVSKNKLLILMIGLVVYMLSSILYLFSKNMIDLIVISCFLGIGCGLVIPIAAGLIADYFKGKARIKQLGIKSGIANVTLIFATLIVGTLSKYGWHLPFLVYMIPIIPILLMPFLRSKYIQKNEILHKTENTTHKKSPLIVLPDPKDTNKNLSLLLLFYFLITFSVISISYYLPFSMQKYGMSTTQVGIVTSLYFLGITIPGFLLPSVMEVLKRWTLILSLVFMMIGLLFLGIFHTYSFILMGSTICGLGYGVLQPIIYDKTALLSVDGTTSTKYLAYVLSANYVAITVSPFIINGIQFLLHNQQKEFPFFISTVVLFLFMLFVYFGRDQFVFKIRT